MFKIVLVLFFLSNSEAAVDCRRITDSSAFVNQSMHLNKVDQSKLMESSDCILKAIISRAEIIDKDGSIPDHFKKIYLSKIRLRTQSHSQIMNQLSGQPDSPEIRRKLATLFNYNSALRGCLIDELGLTKSEKDAVIKANTETPEEIREKKKEYAAQGRIYRPKQRPIFVDSPTRQDFGNMSCKKELLDSYSSKEAELNKVFDIQVAAATRTFKAAPTLDVVQLKVACGQIYKVQSEMEAIKNLAKSVCKASESDPSIPGKGIGSAFHTRHNENLTQAIDGGSAGQTASFITDYCKSDFIKPSGKLILRSKNSMFDWIKPSCNYIDYTYIVPKPSGAELGNQFYDRDCNLNWESYLEAYKRGIAMEYNSPTGINCDGVKVNSPSGSGTR